MNVNFQPFPGTQLVVTNSIMSRILVVEPDEHSQDIELESGIYKLSFKLPNGHTVAETFLTVVPEVPYSARMLSGTIAGN